MINVNENYKSGFFFRTAFFSWPTSSMKKESGRRCKSYLIKTKK